MLAHDEDIVDEIVDDVGRREEEAVVVVRGMMRTCTADDGVELAGTLSNACVIGCGCGVWVGDTPISTGGATDTITVAVVDVVTGGVALSISLAVVAPVTSDAKYESVLVLVPVSITGSAVTSDPVVSGGSSSKDDVA